MKETQLHLKAPVEQSIVKEQKKQSVFLGTIRPHPGQKLFELNLETGYIEEVIPKQEAVVFTDAAKGLTSIRKKVIKKENCLYVSALNFRNAEKKFKKMANLINVKQNG